MVTAVTPPLSRRGRRTNEAQMQFAVAALQLFMLSTAEIAEDRVGPEWFFQIKPIHCRC